VFEECATMRDCEGYTSIRSQVAELEREFPDYLIDVEWHAEGPMFTAKRKRRESAGGLYSVTRPDLSELRRDLAAGASESATR
jgi:hypothetical protein